MRLLERIEDVPILPVAQRVPRAPGLHASTIIHDLCQTLQPDRFGSRASGDEADRTEADLLLADLEIETRPIVFLGAAFDAHLDRLLTAQPGRAGFRPPERAFRGVLLNADRLVWEPEWTGPLAGPIYNPVVEEHKLTRMSGRHDLEDPRFRHWFWQLGFYCAAYDTLRGRIRAFFVNADYRFGQTPETDPQSRHYRVWDVLFTRQERDDIADMLIRHARQRGWL